MGGWLRHRWRSGLVFLAGAALVGISLWSMGTDGPDLAAGSGEEAAAERRAFETETKAEIRRAHAESEARTREAERELAAAEERQRELRTEREARLESAREAARARERARREAEVSREELQHLHQGLEQTDRALDDAHHRLDQLRRPSGELPGSQALRRRMQVARRQIDTLQTERRQTLRRAAALEQTAVAAEERAEEAAQEAERAEEAAAEVSEELEPMERSAAELALAEARPGHATYYDPQTMAVGESDTFWFRLTRGGAATEGGPSTGESHAALPRVTPRMHVELEAHPKDFEIEPFTSGPQPVLEGEPTEWRWSVTPLRPGKNLPVYYYVHAVVPEVPPKFLEVHEIELRVDAEPAAVGFWERQWNAVRKATQAEVLALVTGLVGMLGAFLRGLLRKLFLRLWYGIRNRRRAARHRAARAVELDVTVNERTSPPMRAELHDVSEDGSGLGLRLAEGEDGAVRGATVQVYVDGSVLRGEAVHASGGRLGLHVTEPDRPQAAALV